MSRRSDHSYDVAVVGGGLAGLTAAAMLGRAGKSVVVYERANNLGGRAATQTVERFHFNLGPHALFRGGHAMRVLRSLGITIGEARVGTSGSTAVLGRRVYALPVDLMSILKSRLLTLSARVE